jgi:hypothetical protein
VVLVALGVMLPFSRTLITDQERVAIAEFGRECLSRLTANWPPRAEPAEASHAP